MGGNGKLMLIPYTFNIYPFLTVLIANPSFKNVVYTFSGDERLEKVYVLHIRLFMKIMAVPLSTT